MHHREKQAEISSWWFPSSLLLLPEGESPGFRIKCKKGLKIQGQVGPGGGEAFPHLIKFTVTYEEHY